MMWLIEFMSLKYYFFIAKTYSSDNYEMTDVFNMLHLVIDKDKLYSYKNKETSRAVTPDQFCSGSRDK